MLFSGTESTADRRDGKERNPCTIKELYYFFISNRRIRPGIESGPVGKKEKREGKKESDGVGVRSQQRVRASIGGGWGDSEFDGTSQQRDFKGITSLHLSF